MSTTWYKKVEHAIEDLREIPLWGKCPAFPWKNFNQELQQVLNVRSVDVSHHQTDWREAQELLKGLGTHPIVIPLECAPISERIFWVLSSEDVSKFVSASLTEDKNHKKFSEQPFQEGYYHFLTLEVLRLLDKIKAFKNLVFKRGMPAVLPTDGATCIDISIALEKDRIWGRIIVPNEFLHSFRAHFSHDGELALSAELIQSTNVALHLEIGSVELDGKQWELLNLGDFLILDRCTFDPLHKKGTAKIVLGKTPLLQARIKENRIKILDEAPYEKDVNTMDNPFSENEDEKEDNFSDEEEFSLPEETEEEQEFKHVSDQEGTLTEELLSRSHIPIILTVEIARIRMNLEKVLQLKPGNILDLNLLPEEGVDLTIHGKRVGKGELIKMGDVLGVKILRLGE